MRDLITSSGIIRDSLKPRCGIISVNSELLDQDVIYDLIDINNCIDLSFESYIKDMSDDIESDDIESGPIYLIGSWIKDNLGKYQVDKNGELSGTFDSDSNIIAIEYSKTTRLTHHTSPCYIMSDGRGPCGDLDTKGNTVLSYDLPKEYYKEEVNL